MRAASLACVLQVALVVPVFAGDPPVLPFSQDEQIRFLKLHRQFLQQNVNAAMLERDLQKPGADREALQRRFQQALEEIGKAQQQIEAECVTAARDAHVDLSRFNCDLPQLAFVPKPATAAVGPEEREPPAAPR